MVAARLFVAQRHLSPFSVHFALTLRHASVARCRDISPLGNALAYQRWLRTQLPDHPPFQRSGSRAWKAVKQSTSEFSHWAILNEDLTPQAVPRARSDWSGAYQFALTYDGYALWSDVGSYANRMAGDWRRHAALPRSLDSLRACLCYEQRRHHHFGHEPSDEDAEYIWALLEGIRASCA
jgi:hypothetical protein